MEINYRENGKFEIIKTETITTKLEKTTNDIETDIKNLEEQKSKIQEQIDGLTELLSQVNVKSQEKEVKDKMVLEATLVSEVKPAKLK